MLDQRLREQPAPFRGLAQGVMRVISVVGWKNNGKTTLVVRLVEHLTRMGLKVSTIKHAHHSIDLDQPGKDSWRHREAGAREVVLATSRRWILMHELRDTAEPPLATLLAKLAPVDIVVVEGFKGTSLPKIEVHRAVRGTELIARSDPDVVAVAADIDLQGLAIPVVDLNDIPAVAALVLEHAREIEC
jgi:molybdopterin-guanine dinucleotide biosynthesis protein MobB